MKFRETARFGRGFSLLSVLLFALPCFSVIELRADPAEKEITRSSEGKVVKGQTFEPAQGIPRQNSGRRKLRRRPPTISDVILPPLTPTSREPKSRVPVVRKKPTPRFGYGSNQGWQSDAGKTKGGSVARNSQQARPIYIFSPYYNNTQYLPIIPYSYGSYGYGYPFGSYHPFGCLPSIFSYRSPFLSIRITP